MVWRSMTRLAASILAAALLVVGCNNTQTVDRSSGAPRRVEASTLLIAQSRPPIPDLPIPVGFSLNEGKSRSFAAAGARYVDHVYDGSDNKFAVARFYKRQMPINRWTLVTDMFVQGDIMLDFEKELERCRIIIADGGMFNPTVIKVQLWTSGRIQPPPGTVPAPAKIKSQE